MKTIHILFVAASLSISAGAAQAAAYLKFDGIKGDTAAQHIPQAKLTARKTGGDPAAVPGSIQAPQQAPAALLVPAVQKVREAATR